MSSGYIVKSYLEDALTTTPAMGGCQPDVAIRGALKPGGLTEFSGSYAPTECQLGILGGPDYYRAYRESELARMAPDVLGRSVKSSWDDGFISLITPDKPAPVSLAGYDVFGPQSFTTTTRNMSLDLRGEAAYAPSMSGEVPMGASVSSLAMGAAVNYADCGQGCGCQGGLSGRTVRPLHSEMMRRVATKDGATADDLQQECTLSCLANGGKSAQDCAITCRAMMGRRGGQVATVHSVTVEPPPLARPATVLRPYHV
jgi:hypothetical protein